MLLFTMCVKTVWAMSLQNCWNHTDWTQSLPSSEKGLFFQWVAYLLLNIKMVMFGFFLSFFGLYIFGWNYISKQNTSALTSKALGELHLNKENKSIFFFSYKNANFMSWRTIHSTLGLVSPMSLLTPLDETWKEPSQAYCSHLVSKNKATPSF